MQNLIILKVLLGPILLRQAQQTARTALRSGFHPPRSISENGIELYSFDWLPEPREDVDVFFKHSA